MISFFFSFPMWILGVFSWIDFIQCKREKMKWGIKVRQRPIKDEYLDYLCSLEQNVFEYRPNLPRPELVGFICKTKDDVAIYHRPVGWGTFLPYIGYASFTEPKGFLEYRVSAPILLFLVPFVLTGVGAIFVIAFLLYNDKMEIRAIEVFLKKQISEGSL